MCACLFQMERWRLNFFFSVLMLKKIHGTLVVPSAEIYFYSVRQLCSGLNFNLYCFLGLKPVRLGFVLRYLALFSFLPCWLKWAELAFNVHAEVAAFFDVLHVENLNWLTDLWVTLCLIPCTAVLGCLFFKMPLNQTFCSFFFVPVFSIKQSSRSSEAAEDEKDQRTVTVNPSHMRKAFKVMNELRRYTFDLLGTPLWVSRIVLIERHRK